MFDPFSIHEHVALAQAGAVVSIAVGALVLVVLIIALGYPLLRFRKSLLGGQESGTDDAGGLSLADLRRLHRQGKLTDAEFEAARQIVIGTTTPPLSNEIRDARAARAAHGVQNQANGPSPTKPDPSQA
ncbi:MAG: hypothetical protein AAGI30_01390 [Planctomycetota bacterium]